MQTVFELAVVLGVLVAAVRRADLLALAGLRFRGLWFCFLAFALKLALFALGVHGSQFIVAYGVWLQLAVTVILLGLVAANLHLPGMPVVLIGLLANLLVIVANGGRMPVTTAAMQATEQSGLIPILQRHEDPGHLLVDANTRLPWLADWIPLDALNHKVVSPGDILAALGLTITVGFAVPRRKPAVGGVTGGAAIR
jgi:hypothetical protein